MLELEWLWFYTTYTRVCQRNFIYLIGILAKFVLFEYNHVVIVIESQYRESDFYDLGWERLSLTILMSTWLQLPQCTFKPQKHCFYVIMHKVYEDGKVFKKRRLLKRMALPKRDFAPSKNIFNFQTQNSPRLIYSSQN